MHTPKYIPVWKVQLGYNETINLLWIIYVFDADIKNIEGKPTIFPYNVLKAATKNFDPNCKLGEGGFGSVFKVLSTVDCLVHYYLISFSFSQVRIESLEKNIKINWIKENYRTLFY